jgi:hypothetical protein
MLIRPSFGKEILWFCFAVITILSAPALTASAQVSAEPTTPLKAVTKGIEPNVNQDLLGLGNSIRGGNTEPAGSLAQKTRIRIAVYIGNATCFPAERDENTLNFPKLPRQVDSLKGDWSPLESLGRNVRGATRPRLSWGRSRL